jgi:carbonic anhydrase/acetyltransferase-like protein (isoleucine patch superfamily)
MSGIILPYRGKHPIIAANAFVASTAVITGDVEIGDETSIWYNCVMRGDVHQIRIGSRTNIQDGTVVHCTRDRFACLIGSNITIGHGAILHACVIEDDSFIGMGAIILDGARVESGAMVAAGTLISPGKTVKKGELWAGNPGKMMRSVTPEELAFFAVSAQHYVELGRDYRMAEMVG